MALSFTKTITFPVRTLSEKTGDTLQLILRIKNDDSTESLDAVADFNGCRVLSFGSIEWSYEIDNPLLLPGKMSIVLGKAKKLADDYFFQDSQTIDIDVRAEAEVKLNGITEFYGAIIEDGLRHDVGAETLEFTIAPRTDIINRTMVNDLDGAAVDPFSYAGADKNIVTMMEDVFKLVDSSISYSAGTFLINHDWVYQGNELPAPSSNYIYDITFDELFTDSDVFYANTDSGLKNTGDVLKYIARSFCAFTGLLNEKKAFFKKLFTFDAANTQTLGTVLSHDKGYKWSVLDYVRFTGDQEPPGGGSNPTHEEGTETNLEGRYLDEIGLTLFGGLTHLYSNVLKASRIGTDYWVVLGKDSAIDSGAWLDQLALFCKFWIKYRGDIKKLRTDKFVVEGIGYDFLKDFKYNNYKYNIIQMRKNPAAFNTEIEAIFLGA